MGYTWIFYFQTGYIGKCYSYEGSNDTVAPIPDQPSPPPPHETYKTFPRAMLPKIHFISLSAQWNMCVCLYFNWILRVYFYG